MKSSFVSILLVTYNSQDYLKVCLDSLLKVTYPSKEIIVVDNNSTDQTRAILASYGKNIIVVLSNQNLGYAGGNNLAFEHAKGDYMFVINPDTKVKKDFLQPLVEVMQKDPQVAAAQPLVYLMKSPTKINLSGKETQFLGFDWIRDYLKLAPSKNDDLESFSGCGVLLRAKILKKIGFYDQLYFMYYEDSDLSWRFRLFKYKIKFVPNSVIYHDYKYVPVESYQPLSQKVYYYERNRLITLFKNYSSRTLILLTPILFILELAMLAYFISQGWGGKKLQGYLFIITNWDKIQDCRANIQKKRLIDDRKILKGFKARLLFGEFQIPAVRYILNPLLLSYYFFLRLLI